MVWNKPLPSMDPDIEPFWKALKRHEFNLYHCKKCGAWYFPVACCRNHDNEPLFGNMEWAKASGKGKVFAFNIHHRAFHPGFEKDVPYVYAMIKLEEGPMIGSNVVGCDPYQVKIDMPVEIVFQDITEQFTLPQFRPVAQ
ncbi:MAG: Zn-ribbon domain-containing OB-fold protein [Chloroflexi bacterium]|nr:Zn-ribbon domain-containing OB-fold protein [Chloroflexota bacterium]